MKFVIKPVLFIFIFVLLVVPACGSVGPMPVNRVTTTPVVESSLPETQQFEQEPKSQTSTGNLSEQRLMLYSHVYWTTVWVDAEITSYSPEGSASTTSHVQAWIDQDKTRFRVVSGNLESQPQTMQVSDGERIQSYNYSSGAMEEWMVNPISLEPFNPPDTSSDTIYPHPLGQQMFTPITDLLFPTALAQRTGAYIATGNEIVAGRETIIVEYSRFDGRINDRLWVDLLTGMILKRQAYEKSGNGFLETEYVIKSINFDVTLPEEAFFLDLLQQPVFAQSKDNISYNDAWISQPDNQTTSSEFGDIFFVRRQFGEMQLMRLPADCLVRETACPAAQNVPGYPNEDSTINPLIWSSDGTQAALIVNDRLYVYTPETNTWLLLVRADNFYPPVWSRNNQWLAYVASENDSLDLYLIRIDGSELRKLSEGRSVSNETQMEILEWMDTSHLLVSIFSPNERDFYSVQVNSGAWEFYTVPPMGIKDYQVYSPDGQNAARISYIDRGTRFSLLTTATGEDKEIITLSNASIWPVAWSPDGRFVAFNSYNADITDGAQVFVYDTSGQLGMRQLFRGGQVYSIHWSPTSPTLLLEAEQAGFSRLIVAQVDTSSYKPIALEGVSTSASISGVSWRPPAP